MSADDNNSSDSPSHMSSCSHSDTPSALCSPLPMTVTTTTATKQPKPSEYKDAADPERYRKPDAPLFMCRAHGAATVLCTTAGKTGRNGTAATVGATLFWLTCLFLNNLIARLERLGAVAAVRTFLSSHPRIAEAHVASHAEFERRAESLLEPVHWDFFRAHFLDASDPLQRKYGNAAVSQPTDMKCLHALAAQYLAGADNVIGRVTIAYIMHLHSLLPPSATTEASPTEERHVVGKKRRASTALATEQEAEEDDEDAHIVAIKKQMDDITEFEAFLEAQLAPDGPEPISVASLQAMWPDLCEQARRVVVFLDGRAPRTRRKHRRN